jgi:hypothetical protein
MPSSSAGTIQCHQVVLVVELVELNPRRGVMMRLMQSMVPTQEHCGPVSVVHVELGADHQDRRRHGVETCLSAITPLEE